MEKIPKLYINSTTSVFIGIVAGFTFLLALFLGLGIATNTVFVIGIFFITIIVAVGLLLLGSSK